MTIALYASIWLSTLCLVAGEAGKRLARVRRRRARWAIAAWGAGVGLAIVHTLLALHLVYDWDHARAVTVTAERAAAVYGTAWQGSLFVNYAFITWWLAETAWWWRAPQSYLHRARVTEWAWRVTTCVVVINGTVIFASPAGRMAGVPLAAALVAVWIRRGPT